MANWIEHVSEPRRLVLAWQAPDHFGDRFRWAVGELTRSDNNYRLRYFQSGDEFDQLNSSRKYEELCRLGYRGYPAFDPKTASHGINVLAPFIRRLPPRTRSDFDQYRSYFKLPTSTQASDFALLGLTEAKLPSDGFPLVDPFDSEMSECELFLEVAGYRYYAKDTQLSGSLGEAVQFVPEPDNPRDSNAVKVVVRDQLIGYINRLQASTFLRWIAEGRITGVLERLNGSSDKPRAFIFVRVQARTNKKAA